MNEVKIRTEGNRVLLAVNGKLILNVEWDQGKHLSRAILQKSLEAEENAKAEQVIFDHALLTRKGCNIGLTADPIKMAEVAKEAAWNTDLRRKVRPMQGVKSEAVVPPPSVMMGSDFDRLSLARKADVLRRRHPGLRIQER